MAAEEKGAADKQHLAEERTDFAEDRTILANERTYAGWMRTGFASIAVGVGFNLLTELEPVWVPKLIATAFLLIAIAIFIAAERRACAVIKRLHAHEVKTVKVGFLRLVTGAVIVATLALIASLWLLKLKGGG
jgi:putative membrane protein